MDSVLTSGVLTSVIAKFFGRLGLPCYPGHAMSSTNAGDARRVTRCPRAAAGAPPRRLATGQPRHPATGKVATLPQTWQAAWQPTIITTKYTNHTKDNFQKKRFYSICFFVCLVCFVVNILVFYVSSLPKKGSPSLFR